MAKQKLDLFEFASTTVAEARAAATKIVGRQIAYADTLGAAFDRIPNYVGCHSSILSRSILQNPPEHLPLIHGRIAEPDIYKPLAPIRHRHRSYPSALAHQIGDDPVAIPSIAADPVSRPRLPSVAIHIRAAIRALLRLFYLAECFAKQHSTALVLDCLSANCRSFAQAA